MSTIRWMYPAGAVALVAVASAAVLTNSPTHPTASTSQGGSDRAVSAETERHDNETIIADGVKATSRIAVARVLIDPDTQARVVPLVAELELSYNGQGFNRSMAFEIRPADGAASVGWTLGPVGPAVVDESLVDSVPNHTYQFRIAPRTGVSWKDVRSMADASLSVVEVP